MSQAYNLRSHQDIDDRAYAELPGTEAKPGEFVPHHITPMKSRLGTGREIPGCHPSRWLYELINNNFTTCDLFERARYAKLDTPYAWQHPHRLMINGNQNYATASSRVLSSVCLDCHFHFVFNVQWDEAHGDEACSANQVKWPLSGSQFPWHHLVWAGSDSDPNIADDNSKYYPLLAREYFVCSAPPCTFQLTLEVSEPRMSSWWIKLLLDHDAILEKLNAAREQEPARYDAATDDWAHQAPMNLNTYLKNVLEISSQDEARSISKRNKRFAVLFGPRCSSIFQQLEWSETVEEKEGVDEGMFTPKVPEPPSGPSGTTARGTYRAYIEDVRAEIQCMIHSKGGQAAELCTPLLYELLQCQEVTGVMGNALVDIHRYKLLGVLPNQPKEVVVNAYKRQWELLPSKRKELIEALMGVANDANDEQLSDYAITQSSVFESQLQRQTTNDDDGLVSQALNFLGLQPPNTYSAESLVEAFHHKLAKDPSDATTARSMLLLIAQASKDETYQATLLMEADAKMSLATAKVVLGIAGETGFGPDTLDAAKAKIASADNTEAKATYLDAMEAIADHTSSVDLKWTVTEMRQQNGISVPNHSVGMSVSEKPVNYELPVGLENIGNTCYLNSLLQYLFTVKPVRDIALEYDLFKLGLNDDDIKERRLGGNKMQMDRGEAVVAQAFAQELSELFHNLQTSDKVATRPSQRLANAVLLSTHTLLNDSKSAPEPSTANPPPLPARPSPATPTKTPDDVEMRSVTVDEVPESLETASTMSSQTLVEQGEEDSDHSYEKVEKTVTVPAAQTLETVEQAGGTDPVQERGPTPGSAMNLDGTQEGTQADNDIKMVDADGPQTVDQKVLTALEHQKRSSGTDQQDVEEVMGSILNRLQAAIRPSSIDEKTGIQLEKIMETFFVTTVNYTKKFDDKNYQQEISFDRSITAFPAPEGACSLYDALGRNFDQQIIEESKLSRYTAIKTLPPVLHVLIQRSQSMGSKNGNAVVIPETLYLDRYMDAPHDSFEFRRRVENWMTASRISDLKALKTSVEADPPTGPFLDAYNPGDISQAMDGVPTEPRYTAETDLDVDEKWDFDGPIEDDFLLVNQKPEEPVPIEPAGKPDGMEVLETSVREQIDTELRLRENILDDHFSGLKNIAYRLHAVICHRGHLMSGHYWVWIRDFENDLWRKYNDSNVEVNRNTSEVLGALSTSGEPYFLCYVRDDDKDQYVDVPKRQVPQPSIEPDTDADGDVQVVPSPPVPAKIPETAQDELPPPYEEVNAE